MTDATAPQTIGLDELSTCAQQKQRSPRDHCELPHHCADRGRAGGPRSHLATLQAGGGTLPVAPRYPRDGYASLPSRLNWQGHNAVSTSSPQERRQPTRLRATMPTFEPVSSAWLDEVSVWIARLTPCGASCPTPSYRRNYPWRLSLATLPHAGVYLSAISHPRGRFPTTRSTG